MTKTFVSALALTLGLSLGGAALAQPSGGPGAKGNAPLKPAHTVNDGAAKRGANSFTQKQAQEHIEKSGFTGVTDLVKGDDGVWRGRATRGGATVDVAMDFKGNVSTPAGASAFHKATTAERTGSTTSKTQTTETTTHETTAAATTGASAHHRRAHHGQAVACANPSPNGAACSGVDKNHNGVSDKEDRAIGAGAHP